MKKQFTLLMCCLALMVTGMAQPKMGKISERFIPEKFNKERFLERNFKKGIDWYEPDTVYSYSLDEFSKEEPFFRTVVSHQKEKITELFQTLNPTSNGWVNIKQNVFQFDENGNITEYLVQLWESEKWVNNSVQNQRFDSQNNCIEIMGRIWEDGDWINSTKSTFGYDIRNNLLEFKDYTWNSTYWKCTQIYSFQYNEQNNFTIMTFQYISTYGGEPTYQWQFIYHYDPLKHYLLCEDIYKWESEDWVISGKNIYEYDEQDSLRIHINQEANWETGELENWFKEEYEYDSQNNIKVYLTQRWIEGNWVNNQKETYYYEDNKKEILGEDWENDRWKNMRKDIYIFDIHDNIIENAIQLWENDQWNYFGKRIIGYDVHNNMLVEIFQYPNEEGVLENFEQYVYTYENNNSIAGQHQRWENNTWLDADGTIFAIYYNNMKSNAANYLGIPIYKFTASYVNTGTLSVPVNKPVNTTKLFPNPVSSTLNIETANNDILPEVKIYSPLGVLLINTKGNKIDVSSLANGFYFAKVNEQTFKIVKQ